MTAPVSGSGRWPPWMTRVAKRCAGVSSLMRSSPPALSQPAAQPIEQIDARDEPLKLVVVHDDGHHAALEDLHELRHRGIHRHGHQVTRHGLGHRLVELLVVREHFWTNVLLVDAAVSR